MNAPLTIPAGLRQGSNYPSPVTRILALGYYDGPTEGILQVGPSGDVYRFAMIDEFSGQGANETDLRVFALSPLLPGSLDAAVNALTPFLEPHWPLWVPLWRFPTLEIQQAVEARLDHLLAHTAPVAWQVTTDDLLGSLRSVKSLGPGTSA